MLNFFIVDDSLSIRAMLTEIIVKERLGIVVGEATDGIDINSELLKNYEVDILVIDLLMPERDGIETLRAIMPDFKGKAIMISQVDQKDMIAEAYLLGIDHYITKPLNKYEVISVFKKVIEHYLQQQSLLNIQQSLQSLLAFSQDDGHLNERDDEKVNPIMPAVNDILIDLGLVGEGGYYDLINVIEYLDSIMSERKSRIQFPPLKDLFHNVAQIQISKQQNGGSINKEARASEQRVRRTIHQALENLASLGLTDYSNPTFEYYSAKLFDFSLIRLKMLELEGKKYDHSQYRVNIKKFIETLYIEAKGKIQHHK